MAVRFDDWSDAYTGTTGLPSGTAYSFVCWARMTTATVEYHNILQLRQSAGGNALYLGTGSAGNDLNLATNSSFTSSITLSTGTWYKVAFVVNGTSVALFVGALGSSLTKLTGSGFTGMPSFSGSPSLVVGSDEWGSWWDGRITGVKMWNAALSDAEIAAEFNQFNPVRTTNLLRFHRMATAPGLADSSGNGYTLTAGSSSTTTEDDPPGVPEIASVAAEATISGGLTVTLGAARAAAAQLATGGTLTLTADAARDQEVELATGGQLSTTLDAAADKPAALGAGGALAVTLDAVRDQPVELLAGGALAVALTPGEAAAATIGGALTVSLAATVVPGGTLDMSAGLAVTLDAAGIYGAALGAGGALAVTLDGRPDLPAEMATSTGLTVTLGGTRVVPAALSVAGNLDTEITAVRAVTPTLQMGGVLSLKMIAAGAAAGALNISLWGIDRDAGGKTVPLPHAVKMTVDDVANSPGTISVEYPTAGKNFALLRDNVTARRDLEVEIWLAGRQDSAVRGYLQQAAGDDVDPRGVVTFTGSLMLIRLAEVLVWPQAEDEKKELRVVDATPGELAILLHEQAKARGALTDISRDFTATHDSNGVPWPTAEHVSGKWKPGTTVLAVMQKLVELGLAEVDLTAGRVWRLFAFGGRGQDRSIGATAVTLRRGRNVIEAARRASARDGGTTVLADGSEGLYAVRSNATALAERGRRIEISASAGNLEDQAALDGFAIKTAENVGGGIQERTFGLAFGIGHPRPGVHFGVGDQVRVDTDGALTAERVAQIHLEADAKGVRGTAVTGDLIADRIAALARRLREQESGGVTVGTSTASEDTGIPVAPGGVTIGSYTALTDDGTPTAWVTVSWSAVTQNVDGTACTDLQGYRVQYAYAAEAASWIGVDGVGPTALAAHFTATPETNIVARVAAYDRNGNTSEWSTVAEHTTAAYLAPPQTPSTPVVEEWLGTVRIRWDGKTAAGIDMLAASPAFDHIAVHLDQAASYSPSAATLKGTLWGPGVWVVTDLPYGVAEFACLVAVDSVGNESAPSAFASATPTRVANVDLGDDAVERGNIKALAVGTAEIDNLAVNNAKIADLSVAKLTGGLVTADMIMTGGGRISSGSDSAQQTVMDSAGLRLYNTSHVLTVDLKTADGSALVTGTYRSGLAGERIQLLPNGTQRFYGASGTDYAEFGNDGGILYMRSRAHTSGRRSWVFFDPAQFETAYITSSGTKISRMYLGLTYGVLNAPVTGIRVYNQFTPDDGTENRFHFVVANSGGDIANSVIHYRRNTFKTGPVMVAPALGDEGAGVHWGNNFVAATRGDGNAYVYVDGADFRALSTELAKREIAPLRMPGGHTSLDVVDQVPSYQWVAEQDLRLPGPRRVPLQRPQPDGSSRVEVVDIAFGDVKEPRTHSFPLAEHLQVLAPHLVHQTEEGLLTVGLRDTLGVLWDAVRILSAQVRDLRGQPPPPMVVEGQVLDPGRWAELPPGGGVLADDHPHAAAH